MSYDPSPPADAVLAQPSAGAKGFSSPDWPMAAEEAGKLGVRFSPNGYVPAARFGQLKRADPLPSLRRCMLSRRPRHQLAMPTIHTSDSWVASRWVGVVVVVVVVVAVCVRSKTGRRTYAGGVICLVCLQLCEQPAVIYGTSLFRTARGKCPGAQHVARHASSQAVRTGGSMYVYCAPAGRDSKKRNRH